MQIVLIIAYLAVAASVVWASILASRYIDLLDRTTRLSGAFLGGVLLSAVTSLPELFTSLSATVALHKPSLCLGNILGSNLFNIAILSLCTLAAIRHVGRTRFAKGNIRVAAYIIFIYGIILLDYFELLGPEISSIKIITPIIAVLYILAVRHLSGEQSEPGTDDNTPITLSQKGIILRFIASSIAIIVLSIVMTYITDAVAKEFSIGAGLAGALLLGVATSLPEVSSTIALFRIKNYNIAIGNIVGSNLFNFIVLCIADVACFHESVYIYDDPKITLLLKFGFGAALLSVLMLRIRNPYVRAVCAMASVVCYALFLVI